MEKIRTRTTDTATYLETREDFANDLGLLKDALGTIARAKGMSEIARSAGLGRHSLSKARSRRRGIRNLRPSRACCGRWGVTGGGRCVAETHEQISGVFLAGELQLLLDGPDVSRIGFSHRHRDGGYRP